MSNPLLRPNDPRFQRPELRDAAGKNPFGEGENSTQARSASEGSADGKSDVFTAAAVDDPQPYQPRYGVQQASRGGLWLLLGGLGWLGALTGALSLAGIFTTGWIAPLLAVGPAAAAWLLAFEELKAIRSGAVEENARPRVRLALWLGLTGLLMCLVVIGSMIYRSMNFLPDLL